MIGRVLDLVQRLPHLVGLTDDVGRVIWLNQAGRRFVGAAPEDHLTTADLFTDDVFDRYYADIRPAILESGIWQGELPVRRADGTIGAVEAVIVGEVADADEVRWLATLAVDVTEQHEREARLTHRASHDPLTGLPNRVLLLDRLAVALSVADRLGSPVAVMALDLDGFKAVNDQYGHAVGDRLLEHVTARIQSAVRPADTVARLGGDEFVVVVHPPEDPAAAVHVAERIRDQIGALDCVIDDHEIRVTASIGLTVAAPGVATTPEALLSAADRGMYRAKRSGGNRVRVTGAGRFGVDDHVERVGRELARALAEGQITAAFDPVVNLADGEIYAFEVLARWNHPERGVVPAHEFAEEATVTGYGDLVWWAATRVGLTTAADIDLRLPIEINLSTSQLRAEDLAGQIRSLRRRAPGTPLRLDVDAHSILELATAGQSIIDTLIDEEIDLVLSGHGRAGLPLALLAELPLVAVRLDVSLVRSLREQSRAVALATRITDALDVPCIAQVEDERDLPLLAVLGITAVQGRVTGGEWDAERLAKEVAAGTLRPPLSTDSATRPRPSPSR